MSLESEIRTLAEAIKTLAIAVHQDTHEHRYRQIKGPFEGLDNTYDYDDAQPTQEPTQEPTKEPAPKPEAEEDVSNEVIIDLARRALRAGYREQMSELLSEDMGVGTIDQLKTPEQRRRFVQATEAMLEGAEAA